MGPRRRPRPQHRLCRFSGSRCLTGICRRTKEWVLVAPTEIGKCKVRSGQSPNSAAGLCAATLCVDRETAEAVKQAVIRKNGTFAGELEEYSRYKSDPLLLQKMQRAEVPVWVIGFDRDRAAAVEASNAIQQILHGRGNLIAICGKS